MNICIYADMYRGVGAGAASLMAQACTRRHKRTPAGKPCSEKKSSPCSHAPKNSDKDLPQISKGHRFRNVNWNVPQVIITQPCCRSHCCCAEFCGRCRGCRGQPCNWDAFRRASVYRGSHVVFVFRIDVETVKAVSHHVLAV